MSQALVVGDFLPETEGGINYPVLLDSELVVRFWQKGPRKCMGKGREST